jgi:hypothetical protein
MITISKYVCRYWVLPALTLWTSLASAQLIVTVDPPRIVAQKTVVRLTMKNAFSNTVESARAGMLLLDPQRKLLGQGTRWVIGGTNSTARLPPGATNTFNFVITSDKQIPTNAIAKVTFSRLVLEGGKLADVNKDVQIQTGSK